jgi:hypothetical protein
MSCSSFITSTVHFGWDKNDKPGIQLNQQFVITPEQLEQIRQLRGATDSPTGEGELLLKERKINEH